MMILYGNCELDLCALTLPAHGRRSKSPDEHDTSPLHDDNAYQRKSLVYGCMTIMIIYKNVVHSCMMMVIMQ